MYPTYMFLFVYVEIHKQPFIQLEDKVALLMIKTWRVTHIHKQQVPPPPFRFHLDCLKEQWYVEPNPHPASYFKIKFSCFRFCLEVGGYEYTHDGGTLACLNWEIWTLVEHGAKLMILHQLISSIFYSWI